MTSEEKASALVAVTFDAHDAGIAARQLQRIALDQRIILFPDPAARGLIGRADKPQERVGDIHLRDVVGRKLCRLLRLDPRAVIFRRFVAEFLDRQIGNFLALMNDAETQVIRRADDGRVEAPFVENNLWLPVPSPASAP